MKIKININKSDNDISFNQILILRPQSSNVAQTKYENYLETKSAVTSNSHK